MHGKENRVMVRSRLVFRGSLVVSGLALGLTGCAFEVGGEGEEVGQLDQPFVIAPSGVWAAGASGVTTIKFCSDPSLPSTATQKKRFMAAIARSWGSVAKIQINPSWSTCPTVPAGGSRVLVSNRPGTASASVGHNSSDNYIGIDMTAAVADLTPTAIHEFGHVLGIYHEQVRPDTPTWCTANDRGDTRSDPEGSVTVGAWDPLSIMNYCNDDWTNAILSDNDINGVRDYYGSRARRADQDGDGLADIAVFRPSTATWFVRNSRDAWFSTQYGIVGDKPAPADYDGDGRIDIAVFRPSLGKWWLRTTTSAWTNGLSYGQNGDVPVPADYNGDGKAEVAVFRPSSGTWYIRGGSTVAYGVNGDIPVPADYDGDGKADIAVFRPSNATWYLRTTSVSWWSAQYGVSTDTPVPRDYDGDGKVDIAVYRGSTGTWFIRNTLDSWRIVYSPSGDVPAPADYDGDGRADTTTFRPSTGTWYVYNSELPDAVIPYGVTGDVPVASM
jgi:hypothetical protein